MCFKEELDAWDIVVDDRMEWEMTLCLIGRTIDNGYVGAGEGYVCVVAQ